MQLTQLSQSTREVVDVFNRIAHSRQDLGAVGTQLLRPMMQVEVREVGLRLRVAAEEPGGSGERASLQVLMRVGLGPWLLPWAQILRSTQI